MNSVAMEIRRIEASKQEWRKFALNDVTWDMEREWERHFNELGLSLSQFTGAVLDIGCGPTGAIYYTPNASRRVGIDPAVSAFTDWNSAHSEGRQSVELVEAGAEVIDFPEASFDSVFCINCLDHTTDPERIVHEIHRVLRPGGRIVIFFDIDSPLRKLHKRLRPWCALLHPHSLTYEWVDRVILSSGLFSLDRMTRDRKCFEGRAAKLYEAFWDDLIYRATGWNKFIHHLWLTGIRA